MSIRDRLNRGDGRRADVEGSALAVADASTPSGGWASTIDVPRTVG
jgi:hypothetical protein